MRTFIGIVLFSTTIFAQAAPSLQFKGEQQGSKHAAIAAAPIDVAAAPGGKVSLFVDVTPKPGIHVYAPGSKDYIPISIKMDPSTAVKAGKLTYPKSDIMTFGDEKVPVFQKPFRLTQDVTIAGSAKSGTTIALTGTVTYQACDDKVCFVPASVPVTWTVDVK